VTAGPPPSAPPATTVAPSTATTQPAPSVAPVPISPTPAPPALQLGASGPDVLALQQRLFALGYWVGGTDGRFGDSTEQAVFALQKSAGIPVDGVVGPETRSALARGVRPTPRSTSGTVIEIDLESDLLLFVADGTVEHVLNTSTGGGYYYTDQGITARAETPRGWFHIHRQVDGLVVDSLGELWRPKFFDSGFAIHGDSWVPPEPVSHGCVRVSNEAIDWIWASGLAPLGTAVWVY
jgi:lipoprotein-anchoring transpeptidase ErfK/SrfK